jgi:hypothetical protein
MPDTCFRMKPEAYDVAPFIELMTHLMSRLLLSCWSLANLHADYVADHSRCQIDACRLRIGAGLLFTVCDASSPCSYLRVSRSNIALMPCFSFCAISDNAALSCKTLQTPSAEPHPIRAPESWMANAVSEWSLTCTCSRHNTRLNTSVDHSRHSCNYYSSSHNPSKAAQASLSVSYHSVCSLSLVTLNQSSG